MTDHRQTRQQRLNRRLALLHAVLAAGFFIAFVLWRLKA